jgi:hypothetical protein
MFKIEQTKLSYGLHKMNKELIAYYAEKWNCVWNITHTENKNIQNPEEVIDIIKKEYNLSSDLIFDIQGSEIFVTLNNEDIKINYGECKI